MENVEREEGFWWVRVPPHRTRDIEHGERWVSAEVIHRLLGPVVCWDSHGIPASVVIQWGPYLGKEPETIESLDRKIAEMMATRLPLFTDFDPSRGGVRPMTLAGQAASDAVEGAYRAMTEVTVPSEDGGPPWTVTIPGIKLVTSEACPPEAVYMSTDREIVVIKLGKVRRI
jgi:hypothetical protein